MNLLFRAAFFIIFLCVPPKGAFGESWSLKDGGTREGEAVSFDFGKKVLNLSDPVTGKITPLPTRDLSLRSRHRLLLSPLVQKADRGSLPEAKGRDQIILYVLALFAATAIPGFWVSGWFVTGKLNPVLAFMGAVGSWVIIGILFTFYATLRDRIDGGAGVIFFGTLVTLVAAPVFVSAVYSCTYLKAILLFACHLIAALCLFAIGLVVSEPLLGSERVDTWWSEHIFEPMGLTSVTPEEGQSLQRTSAPSVT